MLYIWSIFKKKMKKDQKPIEYRRYIDEQTGEVYEVPVINHYGKNNKDFEMIFYGHFLEILHDLGNKKVQVLQYIIKNKSKSDNVFIGTVKEISQKLNVNHVTILKTLEILEDKGAIKRKTGVIYIDPNLVSDGRFKDRIMHVYNDLEDETPEKRKNRLNREIERKKQELEQLLRIQNLQNDETEAVSLAEAEELEELFNR